MKKIAIITARGGSKRIPRKNIKLFLGQPIIAYSIQNALNSGLFDEVMVSTDDDEIKEIALSYGASVPFMRSKDKSDDFATTLDVILEVLEQYKSQNQIYDLGCCIYPTAPFAKAQLIREAYEHLEEGKFDSTFPVVQYGNPVQRALKVQNDGKMAMMYPEFQSSRSQDLEKAYYDAGQFYWFRTKVLLDKKALWTDNTGVISISENLVQDIDTQDDWKLAEIKYKLSFEE